MLMSLPPFALGLALPAVLLATGARLSDASPLPPGAVFLEAEAFEERGGWQIDTQFIDLMGSACLIAHGLGTPVADAITRFSIDEETNFHVHVRTRDWVAPWGAPGAPGRFRMIINGQPLGIDFGTRGADWHWQEGGVIKLPAGEHTIALRDITGFNGRCDAILLSPDPNFTPPNQDPKLREIRRAGLNLPASTPDVGHFDFVVVGGGYAGTAAALSAARQGLSVALIQNRPVLGGNGSSEIRVWAKGGTRRNEFPHIGEIVEEFADRATSSPGNYEEFGDELKEEIVRKEDRISLFLNHHAFAIEMVEGSPSPRIAAVTALDTTTGEERRFTGTLFADCTGHGTIGALAKAEFTMLEEGHLGMSNLWYTEETDSPQAFPDVPWALQLDLEDFPEPREATWGGKRYLKGEWFWESGFDRHPIKDLELVRDWNLRAVFGAFASLKRNKPQVYQNHKLAWVAFIGGTRESRLLIGDIVLTEEDIKSAKEFPDSLVATTWELDLHYPKEQYAKKYPDNPFISYAVFNSFPGAKQQGYLIPYRCFYSRNVENLFMAGRNISVTHEALGTVRVMRTCGMMGEVVGKAAYIAVKEETSPRGVYESYLDFLKDLCRQPGWSRRDSLEGDLYLPPGGPVFLPTGMAFFDPAQMEGITVDDAEAELVGDWKAGQGLQGYVGKHYLYAGAGAPATASFNFFVPEEGDFELRYYYQHHENRATNAPITVDIAGEVDKHVIDMTQPAVGGFRSLGTYTIAPGQPVRIIISNTGVDGNIHADCVQAIPAKE